jgi:putative DNA primase/helicase
MARRIVTITLDPQVEIPAAREFHEEPLERVRANRGAFIADVLTLVRAYQLEGVSDETLKRTNGYLQWSDLCRKPLVWLGLPDPCASMFEQLKNDPYREQLANVIDAWYEVFGTESRMVRDILKASEVNKDLEEALLQVCPAKAETIDRRHLGWWIRKNSGKLIGGKRLVRDTTKKRNAESWRIELINPAPKMTDSPDLTDSVKTLDGTDWGQNSRLSRDSRVVSSLEKSVVEAADDAEVF